MKKIRFYCALYMGKLCAFAIRLLAKDRGTNLPGKVALKIAPDLLRQVKGLDLDKAIFVTGTNGKSTTTNLLAHVFQTAGLKVRCNLEGANLLAGVAATLLKDMDLSGHMRSGYLLLEVDERFLPIIHRQLPARHICVTNIQKDQVQRNGEPDVIYRKLRSVLSPDVTLYLNNDEPNAASLARFAGKSVSYGVTQNAKSFQKDGVYTVTMPCPVCASPIQFEAYNIDNIGPFHCTGCDFKSQKDPDFLAADVDFENKTFSVRGVPYHFGYSTPYFLYCYIATLAVARSFGVDAVTCEKAFRDFVNISGRMEDVAAGGKTIHYIRMKQENPETLQSALNVIAADQREKIFLLGLDELVDFHPHYTNTFYAFDCDFKPLIDSHVSRYICFSGTVAYDAALRLLYDGADQEALSVLPTNDDAAIVAELNRYDCDNVYLITWLKKYHQLAGYAKKKGDR